ncbi:type II toxin-antitoxin system RelE/ParE family toxin [Endozoicomonas sp. 8E]|uniref:type II toxin-antitoxin system RelE/ParE family toxin n=1 Tax=Endozoicomonas sp. 8E TaxID=3035692 RepID=UPI0029395104|nr:type II toxin-antitoxin system RelE/ParE family toxin [Endozoicomonas sp. 8E]
MNLTKLTILPASPYEKINLANGSEGIGRGLFCSVKGNHVVILHVFQKKTQKTSKKDLDLGYKRMKEVQHGKLKL